MILPSIYLLDANILINANNKYYALDMVPEFWEWVLYTANAGRIKMPLETFEEVRGGKKDPLSEWMGRTEVEEALILGEQFQSGILNDVISTGYAPDLTDTEIEQIACDPFLVAYGLLDPQNRIVVSDEFRAPSKRRANRKVPDVCSVVGVRCCNTFTMIRELGFATNWNKPS